MKLDAVNCTVPFPVEDDDIRFRCWFYHDAGGGYYANGNTPWQSYLNCLSVMKYKNRCSGMGMRNNVKWFLVNHVRTHEEGGATVVIEGKFSNRLTKVKRMFAEAGLEG